VVDVGLVLCPGGGVSIAVTVAVDVAVGVSVAVGVAMLAVLISRTDAVITINSFKGSKEICGSKILTVITSWSTVEACMVLVGVDGGEIHRHRAAATEMPQARWMKLRWPRHYLKLEGTTQPVRRRPTRRLRRHADGGGGAGDGRHRLGLGFGQGRSMAGATQRGIRFRVRGAWWGWGAGV
jgi:hypothetical protein